MITTLADFVVRCTTATNSEIYDMFEFDCTDNVRNTVYELADSNAKEPLRNAMHNMGFADF